MIFLITVFTAMVACFIGLLIFLICSAKLEDEMAARRTRSGIFDIQATRRAEIRNSVLVPFDPFERHWVFQDRHGGITVEISFPSRGEAVRYARSLDLGVSTNGYVFDTGARRGFWRNVGYIFGLVDRRPVPIRSDRQQTLK